MAYAAGADGPDHAKILQVNNDGTYTLALTVKGEAERIPQKVNVIVILDRSGSMAFDSGVTETTYTRTTTNGNNLYGTLKDAPDVHNDDDFFSLTRYNSGGVNVYTYPSQGSTAYTPGTNNNHNYGLVNGEYVELTRRANGNWYYNNNTTRYYGTRYQLRNNVAAYTGDRYTRQTSQSRLQATQTAVNSLANSLLSHNEQEGDDIVEMALVSFAGTARTDVAPTTSYDTFAAGVNGLNATGATNWEAALQQANGISFGTDDTDPTFVIFFSDGAPTQYNGGGSGQEEEPNMTNSYNAARDDARTLANKVGTDNFYTIFAYGEDYGATYMTNLTSYAGAPAGNNYSASDTAALQQAFNEILEKIEMSGFADIEIDDGTTSNVSTASGTAHLLDVADASTFKYYRAGGTNEDGTEKYDSDANTITDAEGNVTNIGEEWTGDEVPKATLENGEVKWEMGENFILENGVTYTVTFDCWPSQETLDHVASIKNDPTYYDSLAPEIQKYLDKDGNLKTNTSATLSYEDTRTDHVEKEDDPKEFTNPDPVHTTAVENLIVSKEWENDLEDEWKKPTSMELNVTRDGVNTYKVTVGDDNSWKDSVFISTGIMRTNGDNVELLTTGHNFTFTEPDNLTYHWEIDVPTVRPMIINGGVPKLLIKIDDAHPAPAGATTYTLPVSGAVEGGEYYVGSDADLSLTATNERRSSLNLRKVVDGEDAPDDATFPFTLNIKNSLAPETAPTEDEDPGHDSDWWVWISVRDMSETDDPEQAPPVTDAVVSGATSAGGGWYYGVSGQDIVLNVKDGYSIRMNNLPEGSEYTVTEGDLAEGFRFENAAIAIVDGSGTTTDTFAVDKAAKKASGKIEETNTLYQVTMTNVYELTDIEVTKSWVDGSNQDGIRPTAAEFAELLTLSP
ncbi:MAG: VWA domain-containing protein, partial [Firmicutes bacterium]|nr:VWA domain-containing protein [Bacillota bacterium]